MSWKQTPADEPEPDLLALFLAQCRGDLGHPAIDRLPGYSIPRARVLDALIGAVDAALTTAPIWSAVREQTGLDQTAITDGIAWVVAVGLAEPVDRRDEPGAPYLPGEVWRLLLVTDPPLQKES